MSLGFYIVCTRWEPFHCTQSPSQILMMFQKHCANSQLLDISNIHFIASDKETTVRLNIRLHEGLTADLFVTRLARAWPRDLSKHYISSLECLQFFATLPRLEKKFNYVGYLFFLFTCKRTMWLTKRKTWHCAFNGVQWWYRDALVNLTFFKWKCERERFDFGQSGTF